jgi:glycosyltransferase involved in cell wall biosynthesis
MIYNPFNFDEIIEKSNKNSDLSNDEKYLIKDNYICTVTRVDEYQKDLTTLILAYEKLYEQDKIEDKLYIIGDGQSKDDLEKLIKNKQLENQIFFLGKKTNPFIWMKNANLFILSSKFEGLPTVLIEAMILNVFIISSNCKTGPKEILQNGKCGDLFEVGDVEELSNKIEYALKNEEYVKNKIKKVSESLKRFDKDFSLNNLVDIIEK